MTEAEYFAQFAAHDIGLHPDMKIRISETYGDIPLRGEVGTLVYQKNGYWHVDTRYGIEGVHEDAITPIDEW